MPEFDARDGRFRRSLLVLPFDGCNPFLPPFALFCARQIEAGAGRIGAVGLDTTHDCWSGSYSFFTIWRTEIARAAGYNLIERSELPWPRIEFPAIRFKPENFKGEWADGPVVEDPLVYLLVHSDIDGVIHPSEGRHVAERLEQILPALSVEGPHRQAGRYEQYLPGLTVGRVTQEWLEDRTRRFIRGLRVAANAGEDVVFF